MKLIPKLYIAFGILLLVAFFSVGVALWSARQAALSLERTHLAHRVYESFLALSVHNAQLFKQYGDAMLLGDQDDGAHEAALLERIQQDYMTLRHLMAQEIQLVGDEEIEELDRLASIEARISDLLAGYRRLLQESARPNSRNDQKDRLALLVGDVERELNELIQEALDEEAEEVSQVRSETAHRFDTLKILAGLFGLIAAILACTSLLLLVRDIRKPIDKLLTGARALAAGRLDHRIDAVGRSELEDLGRAFNGMADEIASRESELSRANLRLEQAVADRTNELERALRHLKKNDDKRRQLLADVSHELRTPLAIIRGEADIALRGDDKPPEDYREALEKTRSAAKHTSDIVDDLLFVARREAGEARLKLERIDLSELLPWIVDQHATIATQQRAELTYSSNLDQAVLRGDPGRIRQVVQILLDNAMRYGGSTINLRLDVAPNGYAISISDDGPGMTEEELAHAFERFFRGSNAAARYEQGTGLGLPMAKVIVDSHGGEIALISAPGEGLTVCFTLPKRMRLEAVA